MTEGNIYIVGEEHDELCLSVRNYLKVCAEHGVKDNWCFEHEMVCITESELRDEFEVLPTEMNNNVLIPLFTPDSRERHLMCAELSADKVIDVLPELISKSEDIGKEAILNAVHNLAIQEPDIVNEMWTKLTSGMAGTVLTIAENIVGTVFCHALNPVPSFAHPFNGVKDIFTKREELFNNYLKNIELLRVLENKKYLGQKLSNKEKELLKSITSETHFVEKELGGNKDALRMLRTTLKRYAREEGKSFYTNCINRYTIAKRCPLTVGIKHTVEKYNSNSANKQFRVFIRYGKQEVFVHFGRSLSCLLYMMYLIDRKAKEGQATKICFEENKMAFVKICGIVYPAVNAENEFKKICQKGKVEKDGKIQTIRTSLPVNFSEIYDYIEDAVKKLNAYCKDVLCNDIDSYMSALTAPNLNSHITIMPDKIEICPEFEEIYIS